MIRHRPPEGKRAIIPGVEHELRVALGPVGVAGLLALAAGAARRSWRLAALGTACLAADATIPQLRGLAALGRL